MAKGKLEIGPKERAELKVGVNKLRPVSALGDIEPELAKHFREKNIQTLRDLAEADADALKNPSVPSIKNKTLAQRWIRRAKESIDSDS